MEAIAILKQYWGYEAFREPQADIVQSVLSGKDCLALLPTGGGKSICFQVPALAQKGMTLVISPLIALMQDQVERLHKLNIPAAFVNSSMEVQEVDHHLQAAMDGAYKLLYISPERLNTEMFRLRLPNMDLNLIAVDEAHCISQWGYGFRPPYLEIASIREVKPDIPIIALTASATPQVQEDILRSLKLREPSVFKKSFYRPNLRYFVLEEGNVAGRILKICQKTQGTGIVYARTRKLTMKLAAFLKREGVEAAAYHGGMSTSERDETQRAWVDNTHRVIVATNAFGMGIDKPDVRFVLHHNAPFDLESYYQEAGRGGRDGKTALAIAFFNPPDLAEAQRWIALRYPSWKLLSDTYEMLHSHHNIPHTGAVFSQQAFDIQAISKKLEQPLMAVYQAVKLLDTEGLIQLEEESDDYGWLRIKASPNEVLRYRKNHKQVGLVLEHALRKLGGEAYHYEQRFLPGRWAELLTMPVAEVQQHLKTLVKAGMVYYQVPRNHPRITFFQPRQRFSKDLLDWNKYIFLEQRAKARFKALKAYLGKESNCRSLYIQQYFGESSKKTCGVCDLCIARKKKLRTSQSLNDLQSHILAQVKAHPGISYRDLIHQINFGTEAQREAGLRLLIDENLISASEMGLLYSKE